MNNYAILTRFGHYFEVLATDADDARSKAEAEIEDGECPQPGDSVEHIWKNECPIKSIRDDLAEIMAK
jgi:hypothetical protein